MMTLLPAAGSTRPDPVALLMVLVLAVIVAVMAVRKCLHKKRPVGNVPAAAPAAVSAAPAAPQMVPAPGSAGRLKLHDVEPKTAAMLMAITADKMGRPLNELRFLSIKEVRKEL